MLKFADIVGLAQFLMKTRACGGGVKVFDGADDQPREVLVDYGITEAIVKEYNGSKREWAKEKPKAPGWYWVRMQPDDPFVCQLVFDEDGESLVNGETFSRMEDDEYEWAGPLEPPTA